MATTTTTNNQDIWDPRNVLKDNAAVFVHEHNPAEEVIAGKVKKTKQGQVVGVNVYWPAPAWPGKAKNGNGPKFNQAEIDNIGKILDAFRRQPADTKPAAVGFTFKGEDYQAKKEECKSRNAHMRGAVCFSGSKHRLGSKGIYAMMTNDGYVIIVKTKSFNTTQVAVEEGKVLFHGVQNAAIKYAARK